jgi:hypothetical protein
LAGSPTQRKDGIKKEKKETKTNGRNTCGVTQQDRLRPANRTLLPTEHLSGENKETGSQPRLPPRNSKLQGGSLRSVPPHARSCCCCLPVRLQQQERPAARSLPMTDHPSRRPDTRFSFPSPGASYTSHTTPLPAVHLRLRIQERTGDRLSSPSSDRSIDLAS